jgi:hypothetical protein
VLGEHLPEDIGERVDVDDFTVADDAWRQRSACGALDADRART